MAVPVKVPSMSQVNLFENDSNSIRISDATLLWSSDKTGGRTIQTTGDR